MSGAIAPFSHPREIVRALQCYTKCGSGTYAGARKLSRARRMSILGADWSECGGYEKATDDSEDSPALCATEPTCIEVCNQLPECAGFYLRDGKGNAGPKSCVLYTDEMLKTMVETERGSYPNRKTTWDTRTFGTLTPGSTAWAPTLAACAEATTESSASTGFRCAGGVSGRTPRTSDSRS